jgi:peptide/nickel transport system permease protein
MTRRSFVLRRIAQSLLVIYLSYTLVFAVLFVLPGNPIKDKITNPLNPLPEAVVKPLLEYYDLDLPLWQQYLVTLKRTVTGDLGYSLVNGRPVTEVLAQGLSETLVLASIALAFSVLLALGISLTAVFFPVAAVRNAVRVLPAVFLSTPSFLVGFALLVVFSFRLGWVSSIRDEGFVSYVLPALTLAIAVNAPISQVLIQGLSKAKGEPFVTVLKAKGVPAFTIAGRHILKNGSIPALTLTALTVGDLLAGATIVETVFNRTGIGLITEQAVREQDTPVVMAIVVLVSTLFVVINLVTDLLYPVIDPRITLAARRSPRQRRGSLSRRGRRQVVAG